MDLNTRNIVRETKVSLFRRFHCDWEKEGNYGVFYPGEKNRWIHGGDSGGIQVGNLVGIRVEIGWGIW